MPETQRAGNCRQCGEPLAVPRANAAAYCSRACRDAGLREKKRDWWARNRGKGQQAAEPVEAR